MEKRIIYHGSTNIIEKPTFGMGKPYNDYGLGFYCTESVELAKEWASVDSQTNGFANKYELNLNGLRILDLTDEKYSILNWIASSSVMTPKDTASCMTYSLYFLVCALLLIVSINIATFIMSIALPPALLSDSP